MRAVVYHGEGQARLEDRPRPSIDSSHDAIVKMIATTICGTDLHILKGDVSSCRPGRILGHEGIGCVDSVGAAVTRFRPGDRVLISCISACGICENCRRGMTSHCSTGGWVLGNEIDGTQAEYVRIPYADTSLHALVPEADNEAMVMLSDIFPTGFECGVLKGKVEPGSTVAIVGCGPIGLATLLTAKLYSPSMIIMIDRDESRLQVAKQLGATHIISNQDDRQAVAKVMSLTGDRGVDTVVEAVGVPQSFVLCQELVAAGGTIANIGVHGRPVDLHLEKLWSRNITITTRLVDTASTPMLIKSVLSQTLDPRQLVTHRFSLERAEEAYEVFGRASETKALKVIINVSC